MLDRGQSGWRGSWGQRAWDPWEDGDFIALIKGKSQASKGIAAASAQSWRSGCVSISTWTWRLTCLPLLQDWKCVTAGTAPQSYLLHSAPGTRHGDGIY